MPPIASTAATQPPPHHNSHSAGLAVVLEEENSDNSIAGTKQIAPPTLHWSRLLTRLSLFSHVYTHAAREESAQLQALHRAQTLYHRSGRQVKAWFAWMMFVSQDDTSWLERNEWGNSGDSSEAATARVAPLPSYGPLAPWASFVRLLRSRPRLLALLALPPPTGRTVEKVNEVLGYSLLGEKAALAETLSFAFFGQMDAAEEMRAFRAMLRCMIRAEVINARMGGNSGAAAAASPSASAGATATAPSVVEFWCTLSSSSVAPIDKQTHSRAVAGSISLNAGSYNGPISPPSPNVNGPTSAASASLKFRSRPLRMLLLELTLRRIASQSGGFLTHALGDALRPILQDDKTNLDPQAEVVAAILAKAAAASASPPSASPTPPPAEPASSSWWRKGNKNASAASAHQIDTAAAAAAAAAPTPLPVSSPKVKQAVRVTELLLCACVDRLLEALIQAGPRWPSPIKLLLGDALIVSEQLWSRDAISGAGFSSWNRSGLGPSSASPPATSMPYTVDANASIFADDAQMFASSYTAAPPSFLASTSPSPPPAMPSRGRQNSRASGPALSYVPMRREDRPIVLLHILFGLLILPALEKPNLSGVYQDAPLRTRARLNLKVILMLLEQVMVGQPFPLSNPLAVLNKYVATKAATMQAHMMQLAEHCMQLAAEREKDEEELEAEQAAAMHRAAAGATPSSSGAGHGRAIHTVPEGDGTEFFASPPASGLTTPSPVPAQPESTPPATAAQAISGTVLPAFDETAIVAAAAAAAASAASASAAASSSSPFPTAIVSPAPSSAALLPPVVVHHPSLYLSLSELVTLHHALMRHSEKFSGAGASPQDLQLLTTLRNLPLATAGTINTGVAATRGGGGGGGSDGEPTEWKKGQIFEVLMTDSSQSQSQSASSHAGSSGSGGSNGGATRTGIGAAISAAAASRKPFPHMIALSKRIEEFVLRALPKPSFPASSAAVTADAARTHHLQLVVLLAHTFLAVDASCVQMFAGKRSDLLGMLAHARHELEAGLAGRWEIAAQGLALIAELDSKLRVANQRMLTARLAESANQPAATSAASPASSPAAAASNTLSPPPMKRVGSVQQLRTSATPSSSNSWILDPELSALLFQDLERYWTAFELEHAEVQAQDQRTLLYSMHAARTALSSLSLELRLLRDLSFTHKVFIFARQKNNPSQNAHLGRVKFALPSSFVPPDRRDPAMIAAGGSAGPSPPPLLRPQSVQDLRSAGAGGKAGAGTGLAVEPLVIQCTSIDTFLSAFELYGPQLLKSPASASKLFHAFLAILERCVREDAGLHISEMGSTAPNNVVNNIVAGAAGGKDKNGGGSGGGGNGSEANDSSNMASALFAVETALLDSAPSKDAVTGAAMAVLEHSICTRLYRFMFPSDRSSSSFEDELLSWKIKGLEWLTPAHVHLPGLAGDDPVWVRPLREFSQLDHAHSPHSKLQVLLGTLKWLAKLLAVKSQFRHMDADSTLSGLIFLLVKSQPLRLHSNLAYIEAYLPAARMQGENAYVLTQFSLATGYISDTLSVYDQQALEKEMAEQQAREEERRKGPLQAALSPTAAAASVASPPTSVASPLSTSHVTLLSIAVATAGTPVRARSSTLASPSFSGGHGAFSMAPRGTEGSLSLSQSFAVGGAPDHASSGAADEAQLSMMSPRDAAPLSAASAASPDAPLHGRSSSVVVGSLDFGSPPPDHARSSLSHLQQHLRAVQQQQQVGGHSAQMAGFASSSRRSLDDDPVMPRARVFRTPALFSLLLSYFSVAEALDVSCVSTQWRLHIVHATRRASVISARS